MTWAKLSDDFADDCDSLSDSAFRLHVEALVWNGRKLLDCRIPKDHLRRFATHPESVPELLAVGWWTDEGDHYLIRHHSRYQRSKKDVLKQQTANTANGRKGGKAKRTREQAADLGDGEPLSESLSESGNEMDGPGRDKQLEGEHMKTVDDVEWPDVDKCQICGTPMTRTEPDQVAHPNCVPSSLEDRAWSA